MRDHVIFVSPVLAWPPDQGSKLFLLETARALQSLGQVHWVTRSVGSQPDARRALLAEGFDLCLDEGFVSQSFLARMRRRIGIDLRAWRRGVPREEEFVSSPGVKARVRECIAAYPDAIAVAAYWTTSLALEPVPRSRRALVIADVESQAAVEARDAGAPILGSKGIERLARAEAAAFRRAQLLLCLTAEDEKRAARLLQGESTDGEEVRIGRWPASVEVGRLRQPRNRDSDRPLRLLCFGHWPASFNRDGLIWFLRVIWPTIHRERPTAELRLVGRGLDGIAETQAPGVVSVGYVDDLSVELGACDLVVVPLRWAGGLRYRLLEALAASRPVVCTSAAAVGADGQAGRDYLVADTVAEWRSALNLLDDPVRHQRLTEDGHAWVTQNFGRRTLPSRLQSALAPLGAGVRKDS